MTKGYLHPIKCRKGWNNSEHKKKVSKHLEHSLSIRDKRREQVRIAKEVGWVSNTHILWSIEKLGHWKKPSEGHSPTVKCGETSHGNEREPQGALTICWAQGGHQRHIRPLKQTEWAGATHSLSSTECVTDQDTKRNQEKKRHLPTVKHRGRNKSGHWRQWASKGHSHPIGHRGSNKLRHLKETKQVRDNHILSSTEGKSEQDTERIQEQEALTVWRAQRKD